MTAGRLPDACPFPRPFTDGFDDCAAYQPTPFTGLDTAYRPIATGWTCSHLEAAPRHDQLHRFYPRCRLGDASQRLAWVARVRADRLARLRVLQEDFASVLEPLTARLWEVKGHQLRARHEGAADAELDAELEAAAHAFLEGSGSFLRDRESLLEELGLPRAALIELLDVVLRAWVEQADTQTPKIPAEMVARFPVEVRALLLPDAA